MRKSIEVELENFYIDNTDKKEDPYWIAVRLIGPDGRESKDVSAHVKGIFFAGKSLPTIIEVKRKKKEKVTIDFELHEGAPAQTYKAQVITALARKGAPIDLSDEDLTNKLEVEVTFSQERKVAEKDLFNAKKLVDELITIHNPQIFISSDERNWVQRRDYVQALIGSPKVSRLAELKQLHVSMSSLIKSVIAPAVPGDELTGIQDAISRAYNKIFGDKNGPGILDDTGVLTNKMRLSVTMDLLNSVGRPDLAADPEHVNKVIQFFIKSKKEPLLLMLMHPTEFKRKKITEFNYNLFNPESAVIDKDGAVWKLKDRKRHYEVQQRLGKTLVEPIKQYLNIALAIIERAEQLAKSKAKAAA